MKLALLFTAFAFGFTFTTASECPISKWKPQGPGDVRAPCPVLNSLANHGYLPHSGKFITANQTVCALNTALNISEDLGKFLFDFAVTTNPEGANASTFDLDHLGRHNVLEHDASLSRADFALSPTHDPISFNASIFAETTSYWTDPLITIKQAATSRLARVRTSNKTNPDFSLSDLGSAFSVGETAGYMMFFRHKEGTARKKFVEYLFENERLPIELGWSPPKTVIGRAELFDMMQRVVNATGVGPEVAKKMLRRADLHSGRVGGG